MDQRIIKRIEAIRLDKTKGASELAREALLTLKLASEIIDEEWEGFLDSLNQIGSRLILARPTMSSIQNLVARALFEINEAWRKDKERLKGSLLRKFASFKLEELVKESRLSVEKVSRECSRLISNGDVIVTCSYSSTLLGAFVAARKAGKQFTLLIAESLSSGRSYGRMAVERLEGKGVKARAFPDEEMELRVRRADKALVGADSLFPDGSLVNGVPTYWLGAASKKCGVPFYVACETSKFNLLSLLGKEPEVEEGMDLIPASLITAILTEKGVIRPSEIKIHLKEFEKYARFIQNLIGA